MQDQLISFETAKLAKEKGFKEKSYKCFKDSGEEYEGTYLSGDSSIILRPTQSLLQKWLREKHNLNVEVTQHGYNKKDKHFSFRCIVKLITKTKKITVSECVSDIKEDFYIFRTYEGALEQGLLEALKLIKNE